MVPFASGGSGALGFASRRGHGQVQSGTCLLQCEARTIA
jgi:hypothetical protein